MSTPIPKAVLAIDFQNMYHKARQYGNDFFVLDFVQWIKSMYIIKPEDVTIFMSEDFFKDMYAAAKRYVEMAGIVKLSHRIRMTDEYDPVDGRIERYLLEEIKRKDVTHVLLASSDGGFAHLGHKAWCLGKEFHLFPFADPSKKFQRVSDQIVEVKNLSVSGIRY